MIQQVDIRNFKSIRQVSLPLCPFTVLVGPNGAGKTNIVQALQLFGDVLGSGTTDSASRRGWEHLVRRGRKPARGGISISVTLPLRPPFSIFAPPATQPTSDMTMKATITLDGSVKDGEVLIAKEQIVFCSPKDSLELFLDRKLTGADRDTPTISIGEDPQLWQLLAPKLPASATAEEAKETVSDLFSEKTREYWPSDREERRYDRRFLRLLSLQRYFAVPFMRRLFDTCMVTRLRLDNAGLRRDAAAADTGGLGTDGSGLASVIDRLRGREPEPSAAFRGILNQLRKVYPRVTDIKAVRVQPGNLSLLFTEEGVSDLELDSVSDGVLHALALLVSVSSQIGKPPGILAIEEPENAIHPWAIVELLKSFQAPTPAARPRPQLLVTTHSPTVVNGILDPDSLLLVDHSLDRGTLVFRAREKEGALDSILRESGQTLADVWLGGALGGVPGVDS